MKDLGNIEQQDLIRLGFSLGAFGHTFRLDGTADKDWYYLQAVCTPLLWSRVHIYGSSDYQSWELLEVRDVQYVHELAELVEQIVEQKLSKADSLISPIKSIGYRDSNTNTLILL